MWVDLPRLLTIYGSNGVPYVNRAPGELVDIELLKMNKKRLEASKIKSKRHAADVAEFSALIAKLEPKKTGEKKTK